MALVAEPPIAPGAEEALAEAFRSAGEWISCRTRGSVARKTLELNVVGSMGNPIAKVTFQGEMCKPKPAIITLPDGRVASVLYPNTNWYSDRLLCSGTLAGKLLKVSSTYEVTGCCSADGRTIVSGSQNEVLMSVELEPTSQWWEWPFMLCTCCLGACCVHCMTGNPRGLLKKNGQEVGIAIYDTVGFCGGFCSPINSVIYKSEDPDVLIAALMTSVASTILTHFYPSAA